MRTKWKQTVCAALVACIMFAGSASGYQGTGLVTAAEKNTGKKTQADYNADLFCALDKNDSYIFSPYSIIDCLTLCYDGLSDKAKKSLASEGITKETVEKFKEFDKKTDSANLTIANKVYLNKNKKGDYNLNLIRKDFVEELEMNGKAAGIMNRWIATKTHDKIKDLIPDGAVTPSLAMVLINAIYMKRKWLDPGYEKDKILWENKKKYNGFTGEVPVSDVRDVGEHTIVRLDYERETAANNNEIKNGLAMYAVTENDTLGKKEGEITPFNPADTAKYLASFKTQKASKKYDKIYFHMPSYEINYSGSVLAALKKIGLGAALKDEAYKKIGPMEVGEVFHGAYIKTNKNGTEAAAATAMMMEATAMLPSKTPVVREILFNKPFYFVIMDDVSGIILFEGKVNADSLNEAK